MGVPVTAPRDTPGQGKDLAVRGSERTAPEPPLDNGLGVPQCGEPRRLRRARMSPAVSHPLLKEWASARYLSPSASASGRSSISLGRSPSPLRLPPRNPPAGLGPPPVCPRANTPHLTGASHPPQLPRSTPTPPPRDTKGPPRAHQGLHVAPHVAPHVALVPPWWGGVLLLIFSFFWTPAFATVQRRARAGVKWCILVEEP